MSPDSYSLNKCLLQPKFPLKLCTSHCSTQPNARTRSEHMSCRDLFILKHSIAGTCSVAAQHDSHRGSAVINVSYYKIICFTTSHTMPWMHCNTHSLTMNIRETATTAFPLIIFKYLIHSQNVKINLFLHKQVLHVLWGVHSVLLSLYMPSARLASWYPRSSNFHDSSNSSDYRVFWPTCMSHQLLGGCR